MRRDVSTYTFALSGCWFFTIESLSCSLIHSFFSFSFFLSLWCYMSLQPTASPFSGFTLLVHRHLIALLAWQDSSNRERKTHIGAPGGIQTHDPSVCVVEDSACLRYCGHCDQLFEFWVLGIITYFNYNFLLNICSIMLKCLLGPSKEFAVLSKALLRNSRSVILNDKSTTFTALT